MADLLEQAASWLDDMRTKHMSRTAVYSRGVESVELSATLGSTTYEVMDESGATVQAKATDFIVSAGDLVLADECVVPQPGDRIRVTRGEQVLVFEVMDLGGTGHYRPCDPHGTALRIHAKQVDIEDA